MSRQPLPQNQRHRLVLIFTSTRAAPARKTARIDCPRGILDRSLVPLAGGGYFPAFFFRSFWHCSQAVLAPARFSVTLRTASSSWLM